MCFIMSEKVNHDITHASQVILFRYKYAEVYGTCRHALALFKSSSKRERKIFLSVFSAPKRARSEGL